MKAYPQTIEEIFEGNVHYEIPEFQRPYRWTEVDQWKPLWEDVSRMARRLLDEAPDSSEIDFDEEMDGPNPVHFFGAIVIKEAGKQTPTSPTRWTVIDGQQRLTTLQLLLAAAKQTFIDRGLDAAKGIVPLLANAERVYKEKPGYKHKLYLLHRDRRALDLVLEGKPLGVEARKSGVVGCYEYFLKNVASWLDADQEIADPRAVALETILRFHINVVLLALDRQENEYVIYETLNGRGTPLLSWDHIKSFMLNRASEEGRSDEESSAKIGEESNQFADEWWDGDTGSGYARRSRVDAFLAYWLTMKLKRRVDTNPRRASRLAREFQGYVDAQEEHESILGVAEELGLHSVAYQEMEGSEGGDRREVFFSRWQTMNAGVLTPVLLWLSSEVAEQKKQERAFVALESFLVRRMMCGLGTRGYFDVMLGLLQSLDEAGAAEADSAVVEYLAEQSSPRQRWPNDETFLRELALEGQYGRTGVAGARLVMVLKALDMAMRSDRVEQTVSWSKVNIEHLMPVSYEECYPLEEQSEDDDEDAEQRRNRLLHAVGNLTLVTPSFNSSVSNRCWDIKREELEKFAASELNRDVLKHSNSEWKEADIIARGERLGEVALEIWPGPDKI